MLKQASSIGDAAMWKIINLSIPTGVRLVYDLSLHMRPRRHYYV